MATWIIDAAHSEIQFKIRHLLISTVSGSFKKFEGTVQSERDDFTDAKIQFTAETASVDTNNEQRDTHLKSDDFFNAEKFPKIIFTSTEVVKESDDEYILRGNLTIRDVTKLVELDIDYGGTTTDSYGQTKAGFEVTGKIDRQDYGLKWSAVTEAGGVVVSDDVRLIMSIQIVKQQG
jgi:polyisoprenoid-binding protein YceI